MGKKKTASSSEGDSQREDAGTAREKNATFEAACAKIQQNSQKHLSRMQSVVDNADEQDEVALDEESILDKFSEGFSGGKQETQDLLSNILSGQCKAMYLCIFLCGQK